MCISDINHARERIFKSHLKQKHLGENNSFEIKTGFFFWFLLCRFFWIVRDRFWGIYGIYSSETSGEKVDKDSRYLLPKWTRPYISHFFVFQVSRALTWGVTERSERRRGRMLYLSVCGTTMCMSTDRHSDRSAEVRVPAPSSHRRRFMRRWSEPEAPVTERPRSTLAAGWYVEPAGACCQRELRTLLYKQCMLYLYSNLCCIHIAMYVVFI